MKESPLQKQFEELPFEEEILAFLKELGHSGEIKITTDFSTHDEEAKDEESFDPIVQTPSHDDKTDDEDNDEDCDEMNVERDKGANEEDEANELYRDMNINLKGRDIQMTDVHTTQVIEDTHVTLTLVNPEGIDSIFDSTPRVDVSVSTAAEPPLLSATTVPPPTITIIPHMQQTQAPSPINVPTTDLSELELKNILVEKIESNKSIHISDEQKNLYKALVDAYECDKLILDTYRDTVTLKKRRDDEDKDKEPSAGSNRGSKRRREAKEPELKTLESNFLEFMQTNQFAEVVSSIPGIVDKYIDHRMNEAMKVVVRLQSVRLRDEAQAKNEDFLNKLDENI
nr:hypothetical protein [Tanacetum cinerariifolium]